MSFRIFRPALTAVFACLLVSCSASPERYFPGFPYRKPFLGKAVLLQDVFIVEGTATDTAKFDLVWNLRMSDSLHYFLSEELPKRDYFISRTLLASMGMPFAGRTLYSLVSTEEVQDIDIDELPKEPPPFYVDADIDSSEVAKRQWKNICRSLVLTPFDPEATHTIIAEAPEFGKRLNATTLFVCFATGITVPAGERAREVHMHPNKPQGYVAEEKISQASITLYVIDVESGELLWADQNIITGGTVYVGKMHIILHRLLNRLP